MGAHETGSGATPRLLERVRTRASSVVTSRWFARVVVGSIVLNSAVVALETDPGLSARHATSLQIFHAAIVVVLASELATRFLAQGPAWRAFFADPWVRFDLLILVASLVPAVGPMAAIARLARVLRVARIVSVSPKLRLIIATMARSIPSLGHVGLLLGLLLFVYGVLGVHLFREADPAHWGDLGSALLTLFQILTLEGWVEVQRVSMAAEPWAWVFYGSFVVFAVFVVVNLFVAVVLSNLDQARRELAEETAEPTIAEVLSEVRRLRAELHERAGRG
jgi:voltage-gated sodium channel